MLNKTVLTTITLLIVALTICSGQSPVIEFLDVPTIYTIGYGDSEGAFKDYNRKMNRDSIKSILNKELNKYPKGVLLNKARLTRIILCDTIIVADENGEFTKPALGTYLVGPIDGNIVFLDATAKLIPAILHHEISSVILHELAFTDSSFLERAENLLEYFRSVTPYFYKNDSISRIIKETGNQPNNSNNFDVLCNNGYALTDNENDFNEIVKCLFSPKLLKKEHALLVDPNLKLWEFLEEAKNYNFSIYKKVMMVIDLYHAVHPIFNEAYFRKFEN